MLMRAFICVPLCIAAWQDMLLRSVRAFSFFIKINNNNTDTCHANSIGMGTAHQDTRRLLLT